MRVIWALTMAAMAIALPQAASAQVTGDFRLPPASTATPRIQGPTDSEHPVLRTSTPTRDPAPPPAPGPATSAPAPAPVRPASAQTPARQPSVAATTTPSAKATRTPIVTPSADTTLSPSPSPSESPKPETSSSSPIPAAALSDTASTVSNATAPQAAGKTLPLPWPWLAGIVAAILAMGAWWLHGRPAKGSEDDWNDADWLDAGGLKSNQASAPEQPSTPVSVQDSNPAPAPPLAPVETPVRPAFGREILVLSLDPVRMSATLTSTSLSYRLTVTNKGSQVIGPVAIAGSMVSAHASLPTEAQLATDGQLLEVLHEIDSLPPGESTVVTGELRLPLPEITPIRSGESLLFIPLARFRAEASDANVIVAFAIGETADGENTGLLPLRIDMGPRIWNKVSRRQIEMAEAE